MTWQEQISEGQGEGPKEKKTMAMKRGESKNYKQLNKRELISLDNKIEVYFAECIILFVVVVVVVVVVRNYKKLDNNVVRTLQKKFTKLFYGKTMRKPICPREGARKKKIHGGRENKLYPVFLEVPIAKRETIVVEATKIYEAERQEQQECKE